MKTITATVLATFLGASFAFAHQTEGGSTEGLFGLKAEYVHALLNPLPLYGLTMGVLVLAAGLFARSKAARNIGLVLIVQCAASAWPFLYHGQHGYNHVHPQLDAGSQQWLKVRMDGAERFIYSFYLATPVGIASLAWPTSRKTPRSISPSFMPLNDGMHAKDFSRRGDGEKKTTNQ
jgi:hypothetical protein